MKRLIEIRSYVLKPGTAKEFHSLVTSTAIPMLRTWGMEIVAFGPSKHDPGSPICVARIPPVKAEARS